MLSIIWIVLFKKKRVGQMKINIKGEKRYAIATASNLNPDKNKFKRLLGDVIGFRTIKSTLLSVKIKKTISNLVINNR